MIMELSKIYLAFHVFVNSSNFLKKSFLGWNALYLSKKRPKTNLMVF